MNKNPLCRPQHTSTTIRVIIKSLEEKTFETLLNLTESTMLICKQNQQKVKQFSHIKVEIWQTKSFLW